MSSERQPPDDHELEDFLAGRHPVGRAYREASENDSAPPELDAAILAAARESVRTPVARRPRWIQPVALAATLVLGLSVLMNVWRDPQTRGQVVPLAPSSPAPQSMSEESTAEIHSAPSAAAEAAATPATPAPIEMPEKKKTPLAAPKAEAPARDAAPPPPPPPASGAGIERDRSIVDLYEMRENLSIRELSPSTAPAASTPAPASVAPEASREFETRERLYDEQRQRSMQKAMPSAPAEDSADQLGASGAVPFARSVEQWMAKIRAEIERGDESAARDSLLNFRREHPDAVLPADLAAFERAER